MTGARARKSRALATVGAVGPILFFVLVMVLGMLWSGYDPIRDSQSELGAVDSPYRTSMNVAGFMGIGVVILAFAFAYAMTIAPGQAKTLAVALLSIAGIGMIVVGFFPCDPGCVDTTSTGRMHSIFSMPGAIGLPSASMGSAAAFRRDGRFGTVWQWTSFWMGIATLASGPVVAVGMLSGFDGLIQRLGMWTSLAWMAAVSLKLRALTN